MGRVFRAGSLREPSRRRSGSSGSALLWEGPSEGAPGSPAGTGLGCIGGLFVRRLPEVGDNDILTILPEPWEGFPGGEASLSSERVLTPLCI